MEEIIVNSGNNGNRGTCLRGEEEWKRREEGIGMENRKRDGK